MKLVSKRHVGTVPVYDLTVADNHQYCLANGVVTHNTGLLYSANDAWVISRSQEKDGTDLIGYTFTINIEKSRTLKERSKIPLTVTFDGGINRWSGLLDIALELGFVVKPSNGWYQRVDPETGEVQEQKYRAKDTETAEFWEPLLASKEFAAAVEKQYRLNVVNNDEI
jgi:recombination and repair protein|nr:MAG TPA: Recombination and repair protein [Caudoviricetes sp.]